MQNLPEEKNEDLAQNSAADTENVQPHRHNPFEDKKDELTKEEEDALEQFKEAQTERD